MSERIEKPVPSPSLSVDATILGLIFNDDCNAWLLRRRGTQGMVLVESFLAHF